MKKGMQVLVIVLVLVIFAGAALTVALIGTRAGKTHYVCIEVNPKVEILVGGKNKVKSIRPLNEEAKILLIGEELVGKKIGEAVKHFMTLCGKSGYLKLGEDAQNGVKVSVLSGFNQSLETKIVESVNGYFVDSNIYGCVIECPEDLQNYKEAKKYKVSAEHYDLALAVKQWDPAQDMKKLVKKSNKKLIDMIEQQHKNYELEYTSEELANKSKLIDFNRTNYEEHINKISNESTRIFRTKLEKYVKENKKNYEIDWENRYDKWQASEGVVE